MSPHCRATIDTSPVYSLLELMHILYIRLRRSRTLTVSGCFAGKLYASRSSKQQFHCMQKTCSPENDRSSSNTFVFVGTLIEANVETKDGQKVSLKKRSPHPRRFHSYYARRRVQNSTCIDAVQHGVSPLECHNIDGCKLTTTLIICATWW